MKPSEIRTELLEQHRAIRTLMVETKAIAVRWRAGEGDGDELRQSVLRLADRIRTHNLREEELLRDLIPNADAWGPARAAMMADEHVREHARLHTALLGLPSTSAEMAGAGIVALMALLRDHMDREEVVFLCEDVLRDDIVIADQSGG
jgi:hypothetical protein